MIKIDVAQLIMDATKELMKKKSIDDISVKEICAACEISRQTFYKYFKDKYDIPGTIYSRVVREVLEKVDYSNPWYYSIAGMMKLMQEDKSFYMNAVKYAGQNSLEESMSHYIFSEYINVSKEKAGVELTDDIIFAIRYNAHAATHCCLDWIKQGMIEDPYVIAKKIVDCMPEKMRATLKLNYSTFPA